MSVLGASAGISSGPVVLLFFGCFMALLISSFVCLLLLMGRFTVAGCMPGGSSVAGPFSQFVELLLSFPDVPSLLVFNGSFWLAILAC